MTTQIIDIFKGDFLEKQLHLLPKDIILFIREYDDFYKKYFSNNIVKKLNFNVRKFWEKVVDESMYYDPKRYYINTIIYRCCA